MAAETPSMAEDMVDCARSARLMASQLSSTFSLVSAFTLPKTCGWRWTSFLQASSATSSISQPPASSSMRAWKMTCISRSPSSSRRWSLSCSSMASQTS